MLCVCISYVTGFLFFKVSKSSSDFWNGLKLTWKKCADLPMKCFVTSVAELDGKAYVAVMRTEDECFNPLVYDSYKDEWSMLPELRGEAIMLVKLSIILFSNSHNFTYYAHRFYLLFSKLCLV